MLPLSLEHYWHVATDTERLEESQKDMEVDILGKCHSSNTCCEFCHQIELTCKGYSAF